MRHRKAVDDVVGVVVAAAAVPIVGACVGRELHHSERDGRARKSVPVAASADEWVDELRIIARLCACGEQRAQSREQNKTAETQSRRERRFTFHNFAHGSIAHERYERNEKNETARE